MFRPLLQFNFPMVMNKVNLESICQLCSYRQLIFVCGICPFDDSSSVTDKNGSMVGAHLLFCKIVKTAGWISHQKDNNKY